MTTWERFWVYLEFASLNIQDYLIGRKKYGTKAAEKHEVHGSRESSVSRIGLINHKGPTN
jgi:hypothetical protein